jgi:hypothetical protein
MDYNVSIEEFDKQLLEYVKGLKTPNKADLDDIFYLYNKYIDTYSISYCSTCLSANNSIYKYYEKVKLLNI